MVIGVPTIEELKQYLESQGVPLPPDFVLSAWLDMVSAIQACLDGAGYSASEQMMIYLYLLGLFATVNAPRLISSQTAPSGASQSFRYNSMVDKYRATLSALQALDKSGCTDSLIPAEPGAKAGLWVSKGGCC